MQSERCIGNCGRDIAVGQTIFQVYRGGYWPPPYITPDRGNFLGNWCVDCFLRDYGRLVGNQLQPYECSYAFRRRRPVFSTYIVSRRVNRFLT